MDRTSPMCSASHLAANCSMTKVVDTHPKWIEPLASHHTECCMTRYLGAMTSLDRCLILAHLPNTLYADPQDVGELWLQLVAP